MGRKPNALKLKERANADESTTPTVPAVQLEPYNSNPSLQPESSKQPANSTLEGVEPNLHMQSHFAKSYSRKTTRQTCAKVRRSERLKNSIVFTHNQELEQVIEEITLTGGEEGDDHEDAKMPEYSSMSKNMEEKVDYILEMLEAQRKTTDVKATKNSFSGSCSGGDDNTYKSLYIDSQKKVEALMEENYQLNLKFQNALGKIEAYEKGNNPMVCNVLEKFNEILLSSLTKTLAREAGLEHRTTTPAKRKTLD
ncbi:TITIN-LIKE ISOFORM X2 [Salix viminalis]|uniref:TITIN-LIKE ISOFORM X2 n=1 Tax=Salix viminalis TaxID=40686 RepID=A0A6N2MV21_SALVM|nr:TITIN-LIKE ISOFORM X2 [Salix viminalis]